jgi:hypothetical protein
MAITWTRFEGANRSVQGVTTGLTESAPLSPGDGIDLSSVRSLRVYVDAPAGQTFTGTGTWLGYVYSPRLKAWKRAKEFDLDMTDLAGETGGHIATIEVSQSYGRFALVPDSIGVSGGTSLTETLEATGAIGGMDL